MAAIQATFSIISTPTVLTSPATRATSRAGCERATQSPFFGQSSQTFSRNAQNGSTAEASCSQGRVAGVRFHRGVSPLVGWPRRQMPPRATKRASRCRSDAPRVSMGMSPAFGLMGDFWGGPRRHRGDMFAFDNVAQLLENLMKDLPSAQGLRSWDVKETKGAWILRLEVPGYGAEDLSVQVEEKDGVKFLRIFSRKGDENRDRAGNVISDSAFRLRTPLPDSINFQAITADVSKGVMTVTLPKRQVEEEKPQVITVNVTEGESSRGFETGVDVIEAEPEGKENGEQGSDQPAV